MKTFVRQVPQGKALSLEDAVDVLTLQDNVEGVENYATALHLLAQAEVSRVLSWPFVHWNYNYHTRIFQTRGIVQKNKV